MNRGSVCVFMETRSEVFMDLEGVQLIMVQHEKGKKGEEKELLSFPFEIEFLEE